MKLGLVIPAGNCYTSWLASLAIHTGVWWVEWYKEQQSIRHLAWSAPVVFSHQQRVDQTTPADLHYTLTHIHMYTTSMYWTHSITTSSSAVNHLTYIQSINCVQCRYLQRFEVLQSYLVRFLKIIEMQLEW